MKHILYISLLILANFNLNAQCDCTDCPFTIPSNDVDTSFLFISGLDNPTLGVNGQDVCAVNMNFVTDAVDEIFVTLVSPSGSSIQLFVQTGLSSNSNITFDITFLLCSGTPVPDPGFDPNFDSSENWASGGFYTGSYFPNADCLEDLTGAANGQWMLIIEDVIGLDETTLVDWSLEFCDPGDTGCGPEIDCFANAGEITISPDPFCLNDPALDFDLNPEYTGSIPDPTVYGYTYFIVDENDEIVEVTDDPDLTGYAAGTYSVCGVSYLLDDVGLLPIANTGVTLADFENDIINDVICAQTYCLPVIIQVPLDPVVMDWDPFGDLCAFESYTFPIVNFDPTLSYGWDLLNGGVVTAMIINGALVVEPIDPITEICVFINGDCSGNMDCHFFNVLPVPGAPTLDGPSELCIDEGQFDVFVTDDPLSSLYSWTITGPGSIVANLNSSITVNPSGEGSITICATALEGNCEGEETCIDITITDPPPPEIDTELGNCELDGNVEGILNEASSTVFWELISGPGPFIFDNPTAVSTTYSAQQFGIYTIQLTEFLEGCERTNTISIELYTEPTLIVDVICENGQYYYIVTPQDGNPPYNFNGVELSSAQWTSPLYGSGEPGAFTYGDVDPCVYTYISTEFCPCVSEAGSMSSTPIDICGIEDANGEHLGGEFLDGNDIGMYYLHTSAGATLGTIINQNSTGVFSFLASMVFGQTYYISFVVGNVSDITGEIILTDDCLSVSVGQPVTWHMIPEVILPDDYGICGINTTILGSVTSGFPFQWEVTSSPIGSSPVMLNSSSLEIELIMDVSGEYTISLSTDSEFCNEMDEIVIEVYEPLDIINLLEVCDEDEYNVSFSITGGTEPYSVNGDPIAGNIFESDNIPSGDSYLLEITDINGCVLSGIQGVKNCDCETDAGNMDDDLIVICDISETIQGIHLEDQILAIDDIQLFILHDSLNGPGNILNSNMTGEFGFLPPVEIGKVYYISLLVGPSDGNGGIDMNSTCTDLSNGQPIMWQQSPLVILPDSIYTCNDSVLILADFISADFDALDFTFVSQPSGSSPGVTQNNDSTIIVCDLPGEYALELLVGIDGCTSNDTIVIVNQELTITPIEYTCDSLTGTYEAEFYVSGGNPPYLVNGQPIDSNFICIHGINSGEGLDITISESSNCTPIELSLFTMCDCYIPMHIMSQDTIKLCDDEVFMFEYISTEQLANEDVGVYIVHTSPNDTLGVLVNYSMTGEIGFDAPMLAGQVYYVSYVSGDSLEDGYLDLMDPCLSVSFGQPFIFENTPTIDAGPDMKYCDVQFTLDGSGSDEVIWTILSSPFEALVDIEDENSAVTDVFVVGQGLFTFVLSTIGNHCFASDTVTIEIFEPLSVATNIICESDNSGYIVETSIQGGSGIYFVDGNPISDTFFISPILANGSNYSFEITDFENCVPVVVSGTHDCSCPSVVGNLPDQETMLCAGEDYMIVYVNPPTVSSGFDSELILHDGDQNAIGTIYAIIDGTNLPYSPTYPLNTVLHITPVVGPVVNGEIDLDDNCAFLGSSETIIWESLAILDVIVPNNVCEGDTALLTITLEEVSFPQDIMIQASGSSYTFTIISSAPIVIEIPITNTGMLDLDFSVDFCIDPNTQFNYSIPIENCDCIIYDFIPEDTICTELQSIDLSTMLIGPVNGDWVINSSSGSAAPVLENSILDISNATNGLTILAFTPTDLEACDSTYLYYLQIEEFVTIDVLEDQLFHCEGDPGIIALNDQISNLHPNGQWIVNILLEPDVFDGNTLDLGKLEPNTYYFQYYLSPAPIVCPYDMPTFEIIVSSVPDFIITTTDPDCISEDGSILISIVDSTTTINSIVVNGSLVDSPNLDDLSPGSYDIEITDENLCLYLESVFIEEGADININLEGQVDLNPEGNVATVIATTNAENASFQWLVNGSESGQNDSILQIMITEDITVSIIITDENGCTIEDFIFLQLVEPKVDPILPNIFNPNSSSGNSEFFIPPFSKISEVESFQIYDRWGSLIFEKKNYDPSLSRDGWDGYYNGSRSTSGVYVYLIQYVDDSGQRQVIHGDLALMW